MRISSTPVDDHTVVRIHCGRLDASVADDLSASLNDALESISGRAVVDLAEVAFIDSSALGALVGAIAPGGDRDVALAGIRPFVRTVFRLTRVDRAITILE